MAFKEIMDALRRDGNDSNTVIGIIILLMMLVYIGPDVLPQLLANTLPFLDAGLPCNFVRTADDRGLHQSLIGRAATDPLTLNVEPDIFPAERDRPWIIRIEVVNRTIGAVPFVFNPDQVIIGDNPSSSGLGLIFTPPAQLTLDSNGDGVANARASDPATFPRDNIRILGPRQRCVHRVAIPPGQLTALSPETTQIQVRTYYRINTAGAVLNPAGSVFPDQGLNVIQGALIESVNVPIPFIAVTNQAPQ